MGECGGCKWYAPDAPDAHGSPVSEGECRRYPPVVVVREAALPGAEVVTRFPVVQLSYWCGEWELNPEFARDDPR